MLAPGSGWQQFFFPTADLSDWSANVDGSFGLPPADAAFDLMNATVLRMINAPTDTSDFSPIAAQLGVDDIAAVPEPASILLLGAALLGLAVAKDDACSPDRRGPASPPESRRRRKARRR